MILSSYLSNEDDVSAAEEFILAGIYCVVAFDSSSLDNLWFIKVFDVFKTGRLLTITTTRLLQYNLISKEHF